MSETVFRVSKEMVVAWTPVENRSGAPGMLAAGFSRERIKSEFNRDSLLGSLVAGAVLILGLIMVFRAASQVSRRLADLVEHAGRVAAGDLSAGDLVLESGDEVDGLGLAFNQMRSTLRTVMASLQETAVKIDASSTQVLAAASHQEASASQQAAAIEETRRTMESLLKASQRIASATEVVLENAERTQENNARIAAKNEELAAHIQRITEILEGIKDIANKSDLLALNAALEGTKAGEAGKGFSLVANQMQRLAESVMSNVTDIKALVADVREAGNSAVIASEEGARLASQTTESSRQIRMIAQQQETGTEQVSQSMEEASKSVSEVLSGVREYSDSMRELSLLAAELRSTAEKFQLG